MRTIFALFVTMLLTALRSAIRERVRPEREADKAKGTVVGMLSSGGCECGSPVGRARENRNGSKRHPRKRSARDLSRRPRDRNQPGARTHVRGKRERS